MSASKGFMLVKEIEALVDKYKAEGVSFMINVMTRVDPAEAVSHFSALPAPDALEVLVGLSDVNRMTPLDQMNAVSSLNDQISSKLFCEELGYEGMSC